MFARVLMYLLEQCGIGTIVANKIVENSCASIRGNPSISASL